MTGDDALIIAKNFAKKLVASTTGMASLAATAVQKHIEESTNLVTDDNFGEKANAYLPKWLEENGITGGGNTSAGVTVSNVALIPSNQPHTNLRARKLEDTATNYRYGSRTRLVNVGKIRRIGVYTGIKADTTIHCNLLADDLTTVYASTEVEATAGSNQMLYFYFDDVEISETHFYLEIYDENKGLSAELKVGNTDIFGATTDNTNYYANNGTGSTGYWVSGNTSFAPVIYLWTPDDYVIHNSQSCYHKTWTAMGDSITDTFSAGTYANAPTKYHGMIAKELDLKVYDEGYGGTGYLNSGNGAYHDFIYRLENDFIAESDIVTVMGSINDIPGYLVGGDYTIGTVEDEASADSTSYCGVLKYFIDTFFTKYPNTKLGIISMPPTRDYNSHITDTASANNKVCREMIQAQEDVCKYYGVPFLNLYNSLRPWDDAFYANYFDDNTHPNDEGHKLLAPIIREFIKQML